MESLAYKWTLNMPTASLSTAIWAVAWMAILLNLFKLDFIVQDTVVSKWIGYDVRALLVWADLRHTVHSVSGIAEGIGSLKLLVHFYTQYVMQESTKLALSSLNYFIMHFHHFNFLSNCI